MLPPAPIQPGVGIPRPAGTAGRPRWGTQAATWTRNCWVEPAGFGLARREGRRHGRPCRGGRRPPAAGRGTAPPTNPVRWRPRCGSGRPGAAGGGGAVPGRVGRDDGHGHRHARPRARCRSWSPSPRACRGWRWAAPRSESGPGTVDWGSTAGRRRRCPAPPLGTAGGLETHRGDHQLVERDQRGGGGQGRRASPRAATGPSGAVATGGGTHTDGRRWNGDVLGGGRRPAATRNPASARSKARPSAAISVAAWPSEIRVAGAGGAAVGPGAGDREGLHAEEPVDGGAEPDGGRRHAAAITWVNRAVRSPAGGGEADGGGLGGLVGGREHGRVEPLLEDRPAPSRGTPGWLGGRALRP